MSVYPDVPNQDLLDRIPLGAGSVLDVGCGSAALSLEYRRRNPAARLFGIEREPNAAAIARRRMDRLFETDLEQDLVPFRDAVPAGGFGCIVYGDVLEHLSDPWAALREQSRFLSDDGTVLVCMPNVEHWSFAERLLRGAWSYEPVGLFDRTHLRWFSPETTRAALAEAGLAPVDVIARVFDAEAAERFVRTIQPGLERLGVDPQSYLRRAMALQHIWRAKRRPVSAIAVISTMLAPIGGVSEVRVVQPMRAIASDPGVSATVLSGQPMPRLPDQMPRIFVLHRPALLGEQGIETVRALIAQGFLVVCEFDDHPDYIPILQRPDVQNFRAVHAVQTSTEPLAALLRRDNPEVAVFPNAVARLTEPRNFDRLDRLTAFLGGINREQDWPPLLAALNAAAAQAGERLHFRIVADRGLYDALETPHKDFTPLCDYETYTALLARSEICVMPLADTPFNRCKSDLKFLEASAHRLTSVASTIVYGDSIEDGRTGLLFRDGAELEDRLMRVLADPAAARGMADAARDGVARTRMLAYQVDARIAWYRSLWDRREALQAALLARVPELAAPDRGASGLDAPERDAPALAPAT